MENTNKIIDCFMFWNEIEILYIRLDILYNYVDYFIICECKLSHSGKIKKDEYNFIKNKQLYEKFLDKIIFISLDDNEFKQNGDTAKNQNILWPNEHKQRQWLYNEIKKFPPNTIVAISDIDEIWNPDKLPYIKNNIKMFTICGVEQTLFYYYLNCKKTQLWRGTYFIENKNLSYDKIQLYRNERCRLPSYVDGGWHFSWIGDQTKIKEKFQCIAEHDIINQYSNIENITDCITNIKDLFNRKDNITEILDMSSNLLPKNIKMYVEKFPQLYFTQQFSSN
jgi:beta-1,4-mannosyl-glycoprotein beta-1,4-N-acetylglucosaminyltransferase